MANDKRKTQESVESLVTKQFKRLLKDYDEKIKTIRAKYGSIIEDE